MAEKFEHKKSLGQNFLNSDYVPRQMCAAAGDIAGETVLEIGPGTGALTREILARGARVIAVEADERAIMSLRETFADAIARGQLTLHHHDARIIKPAQFGLANHSYIVISNIPYYLTGNLFRQLLDTTNQPKTLVFLIQKEVAERIARDKKESLLSLSVKVFGDPSYICTVKRSHFSPPPKVDSAIVAVKNIHKNRVGEISHADFFKVIHLGFAQKRKQLLGNLSKSFPRTTAEVALTKTRLTLDVRAEDVPLAKWIELTQALHALNTTN
ncbi:MAG: ribosomal RNA small subunit methyltransferase A [Candidatus Nomurabacteria bacterium]|nr:MAG: ribosomal RNA small subunit methyltransferase A [Candidatus Nomurabacteria bacterium]